MADGRGPALARGRKISEVLARDVLKDASRQGLGPGARLGSESEMIERLGVGRASVREALRILEVHGLVRIRSGPGGGPVLTKASSRDFGRTSALYFMAEGATYREVIEARAPLTGVVARLAAERAGLDGAARLEASIEGTRRASGLDDRAWADTASSFYATIAELCQNRVAGLFCLALMSIYLEHLPPMRLGPAHRERIVTVHEEIAAAVRRGDGATADRLMSDHLAEFARQVAETHPAFMDEVVDWE
jgi:GntR family transcriptional regulator, transcriptional repressor for pyruvate dehydrogenase complex